MPRRRSSRIGPAKLRANVLLLANPLAMGIIDPPVLNADNLQEYLASTFKYLVSNVNRDLKKCESQPSNENYSRLMIGLGRVFMVKQIFGYFFEDSRPASVKKMIVESDMLARHVQEQLMAAGWLE